MVTQELETGFYLDLPLQSFIERFTVTNIKDFFLVDELHADENLKYFSLISYQTPPLKHKTIYNPPLEHTHGTDSTATGTGSDVIVPVVGTITYRLSFYNYKGYTLVKIKNTTETKEIYLFKKVDLDFWNKTLNKIKKDFYS